MRLFVAIIVLSCVDFPLAASVVTQSSCTANQISVIDPTSCLLTASGSASNGSASAISTASYLFSGNTFSVNINSVASAIASQNPYGSTSAASSSTMTIQFTTLGAPRSGFLVLTASGFSSGPLGPAGASLGYNLVASNGTGFAGACDSVMGCNPPSRPVPIELGTTLQFLENAVAFAQSVNSMVNNGNSSANAFMNATFTFYEADGVTPVPLVAAPEPSTFILLGIGMLALLRYKLDGKESHDPMDPASPDENQRDSNRRWPSIFR